MGETQQGSLFGGGGLNAYGQPETDVPMRAHAGDPVTSHAAAERCSRSGRVKRNREIALGLVIANPGLTGYELWAAASDADRDKIGNVYEAYRRLADLKNVKRVRQGPPRKCRVKGTSMVVWFAEA